MEHMKVIKWVIHEYSKKDGGLDATMSYPKDCDHLYKQALSSQPDHIIKVGLGLIDVNDTEYEHKLKTGKYFIPKRELATWAK